MSTPNTGSNTPRWINFDRWDGQCVVLLGEVGGENAGHPDEFFDDAAAGLLCGQPGSLVVGRAGRSRGRPKVCRAACIAAAPWARSVSVSSRRNGLGSAIWWRWCGDSPRPIGRGYGDARTEMRGFTGEHQRRGSIVFGHTVGVPRASTDIVAADATSVAEIQAKVVAVRGLQVMLDSDLAELYGVETKRLVEQVRRNAERFPEDFMFQLTDEEASALRSQSATSKPGRGGRRYAPYAFTEQGVAMLSGVLRSPQAVAVNVEIMRAFVALRRLAHSHEELARRVDDLEREMRVKLGEHDEHFAKIVEALKQLTAPPTPPRRQIGFVRQDADT